MHFSKIYLQDNFVPNYVEDQFRRKVIGIEITINEGESLDEAKQTAENYIKEYIQANTVVPHQHIEERFISQPPEPTVLPEIKRDRMEEDVIKVWVRDIEKCENESQLNSWGILAKTHPELEHAYFEKLKQLHP